MPREGTGRRRRRARDGDAASSQGGEDAASSVGTESRADGAEAVEQRERGKVNANDCAGERGRASPGDDASIRPCRCCCAHIHPCVNVD